MANILIDLGHPSDVHIFRFAAQRLQALGHRAYFSVLDREMIAELADEYAFEYHIVYRRTGGRTSLLREIPIRTWNVWKFAQNKQIDIFVATPNPTIGLPAFVMRKPYLAIADTEPSYNQLNSALPFASIVITPEVYYRSIGAKQVRFAGYKELAYLHPDVYLPQDDALQAIGLSQDEPYFVVRFVSWNATHDIGEHGLSMEAKRAIIAELSQHGKIILSTEDDDIPDEFQHLITKFPKDRMHDLLAFARMYVGEGNTMAAEAAVLGTPSIRANTMDLGYCRDLQQRGLMYQLLDQQAIVSQVQHIIATDPTEFEQRHAQLLADNISVTDFLVEQILKLLNRA